MSDRLLSESEYSLANFINTYVSGCFIVSPDFDWDRTSTKSIRNLPFYAVRFVEEINSPGFVDGGNTNDPSMIFSVTACGRNQRESREMIGQLKQTMRTATFVASGVGYWMSSYNGVPLYDTSLTGSSTAPVGALNYEIGPADDIFHDDKTSFANLKYSSRVEITLSTIYRTNGTDLL